MKVLVLVGWLFFSWEYICVVDCYIHELPSYFPRCRLSDPKKNECLLKATETVKPFLQKGVPELGIPSIEPLHVPEISLQQGTQAVNFKTVLTNVLIYGLSNYKFSKFDFYPENLTIISKGEWEDMKLVGDYATNGRLLVAPVVGKGKFTAGIKHGYTEFDQQCEKYKKKGVDYLRPVDTRTFIKIDKPQFVMDGIFEGGEEINKIANKVIDDNIDVLFEEIRPVVEKIVASIVKEGVLKNLIDNIPYNNLYDA